MTEERTIKFKLQEESLFATKLSLDETLFNTRQKLKNDLPIKSIFVFPDGTKILKNSEDKFILKEIAEKKKQPNGIIYYIVNLDENDDREKQEEEKNEKNSEEEEENPDDELESNNGEEDNEHSHNISTKDNSNSGNKDISKEKNDEDQIKKKHKNCSVENPIIKNTNFTDAPTANQLTEDLNKSLFIDKYIKNFEKEELSNYKIIEKKGNLNIYLYPSVKLKDKEEINALSLMVVGQTGCGKTTLLNSFINSLLGVKFSDNYRFKIISEKTGRSQAHSQTDNVNYYYIRSRNGYPLVKIIDTPGYEDTGGLEKDKEITSQIKKLFEEKISTLNAVCFVAKSTDNRLTNSQKYILNSILDLFGEDIKENFVFMFPFFDEDNEDELNIIETLQEKDSPFSEIINLLGDPWYFTFSNPVMFRDNKRNESENRRKWEINMKNFEEFKKKLKHLPRKSIKSSRIVLEQRLFLEGQVKILFNKLKDGINKIEEMKDIIKIVKKLKNELNNSKNYTETIRQPVMKKISIKSPLFATTCLKCLRTCHPACYISEDKNKKKCSAMDKKGYCIYCPNKCHWSEHKNQNYIIDYVMEEKTITYEELKKRYDICTNNISEQKKLFYATKKDLIEIKTDCLKTQDEMIKSINLLYKKALNKSVFESAEEYIDLLIEEEKAEHKTGWQSRVDGLMLFKKEKKMLKEIYQGENQNFNQLKDFVEKIVDKYYEIDVNSSNIEQLINDS